MAAQQPPLLQVVQHLALRGSREGTLMVGVRVAAAAAQQQPQQNSQVASGNTDGGGDSTLLHVMQLLPWQLMAQASSLQIKLNGRVGGSQPLLAVLLLICQCCAPAAALDGWAAGPSQIVF